MTYHSFTKNPYAPPENIPQEPPESEELQKMLARFRKTDAAITNLAFQCLIFGIFFVFLVFHVSFVTVPPEAESFRLPYFAFSNISGFFFLALSFFLFRRTEKSRFIALCMFILLLFVFPLGTIYGIYGLQLLKKPLSKKIFSPEYPLLLQQSNEKLKNFFIVRFLLALSFSILLLFLFSFMLFSLKPQLHKMIIPPHIDIKKEIEKANRRPYLPE
ncbi:MAG: hypothetical protein Q4C96_01455 [Planctomycetia bacterium]|nr:hypothetical protein [Planctomycetia bacterium]